VVGILVVVVVVSFYLEIRRERKAREYVEVRSQLNRLDHERALALMGRYQCTSCPICLEDFRSGSVEYENETNGNEDVIGSDGLPVRVLRCGHAFDETCFKDWIRMGRSSDVTKCPVCKMDITGDSTTTTTTRTTPVDDISTNSDNNDDDDDNDDDSFSSSSSSSDDDNDVTDPFFSTTTTTTEQRHSLQRGWYQSERNFRLTRIRDRYPEYVQPSQLERWMRSNYEDSLPNDREFVRRDPAQDNTERSASGSRSSRSYRESSGGGFGGGRFGGGGQSTGGVGSRW